MYLLFRKIIDIIPHLDRAWGRDASLPLIDKTLSLTKHNYIATGSRGGGNPIHTKASLLCKIIPL